MAAQPWRLLGGASVALILAMPGHTAELNPALKLTFNHFSEDKLSEYSSGWSSDYANRSNELALNYQQGALAISGGIQRFAGTRFGLDNQTRKTNRAAYLQGDYALGNTTVSLGGRRAQVDEAAQQEDGPEGDEDDADATLTVHADLPAERGRFGLRSASTHHGPWGVGGCRLLSASRRFPPRAVGRR